MSEGPTELRFGSARLQPAQRRLLIDAEPAKLGARAFDVLLTLAERRDRIVTKQELFDLVWPDVVVEENNLQVQISTLRKLLGPEVIATIPGRGYRFTADVDAASSPAVKAVPPPESASQDSLLGRDDELRAIDALLARHRLVSIVGAAGIGKTRLAQTIAYRAFERDADAVCVVELAPVAHSSMVAPAIARALRITLSGRRPDQDVLIDALRDRALLLVLDNCEHLVEAVGALVQSLLATSPRIRVLVTSQEPLRLADERQYRLGTLAVPADDSLDDAEKFGAVALFVDRTKAFDPRFALTDDNRAAVVEICRRLDGIALAIELAAARVSLLGVAGVLARLDQRFQLLTGGSRFVLPRHQTLHAALDWSHELLTSSERAVLRRISVFVAGFSLEAAQDVGADETLDRWSVLDHLGALVDKSLVVVDSGATPRYRLLETTRAYALEQLDRAGETDAMLERHARATLRMFEQAEEARFSERCSIGMQEVVARVQPEIDNLRAALKWATAAGRHRPLAFALAGASADALRAAGSISEHAEVILSLRETIDDESLDDDVAARFWVAIAGLGAIGGVPAEATIDACHRAERIYAQNAFPRQLCRTMLLRGWVLIMLGRSVEAGALVEQIVAMEEPSWPRWLRGGRLNLQSSIATQQLRFADALAISLEWERVLSDTSDVYSRLLCLYWRSAILACMGQWPTVVSLMQSVAEQARLHRLEGLLGLVYAQLTEAFAALDRLDEGREALRMAVPHWRRDGIVNRFCEQATVLIAKAGRHADAARLDGARQAFLASVGIGRHPQEDLRREALFACFASAGVASADIERWAEEGANLDERQLLALCEAAAVA